PLAVAAIFKAAGAEIMHVVDLDGAKSGERKNAPIVRSLCENSGLKVELGGGLRSMADLEEMDKLGVWRMIIGSAAVTDPDFVAAAVARFGSERIAVGIDALDGRVRTHGWVEDSGVDAYEFAEKMAALGAGTIIFTDISRDGTLAGPPIAELKRLCAGIGCGIVASGGVSGIEDIAAIKECGAAGAIIGKAFYAGAIDLSEAVKLAGK
ncbi:MAG: 1-(5-phosphoribosyl)-5-((5-phosphoribosylamino)methylideneamino)imidazole-4-carboxamide isomerase, partial [Oscillospiraceae bacterium]|nr:1-(5-phosphoribosyl)-5-((5-phosphoribosylamino)methylideneamino)imidazole-4-carboxamide isomerase [Oscillospiraceae bacterium]